MDKIVCTQHTSNRELIVDSLKQVYNNTESFFISACTYFCCYCIFTLKIIMNNKLYVFMFFISNRILWLFPIVSYPSWSILFDGKKLKQNSNAKKVNKKGRTTNTYTQYTTDISTVILQQINWLAEGQNNKKRRESKK